MASLQMTRSLNGATVRAARPSAVTRSRLVCRAEDTKVAKVCALGSAARMRGKEAHDLSG
jgi:hypothetical protein